MNTQKQDAEPTPGMDLYVEVRAGFVRQRSSFSQWCMARGVSPQNARGAMIGAWTGPTANALVRDAVAAAQIDRR